MNTVSVVIPNYNYGRFLAAAIESVLAQTYPLIDITVVDDGSTDDSLEILAGFGDRVSVIKQANLGVGAARNTGVKNSGGEFIAFLDSDDTWQHDKIEKQVSRFLADENVGLVSCGMQEFDLDGNKLDVYLAEGEGDIRLLMLAFIPQVVSGSAVAVRRSFFEKAGGFDERKEMHPSEDWEFYYRMAGTGGIAFVPELLVNYRNHGGNGHLKIPRMERSVMLAFEKIFANAPREIQKIRGESYGNMHFVLSGSYLHAGNIGKSIGHGVKSVMHYPQILPRLLAKIFHRTKA